MKPTYAPFDPADYLDNDEVIAEYLSAAVEDPDPNVFLAALGDAAKARGMVTIALTGRDGGPVGAEADIHLNVAELSTPRVQEVHRTVLHAMCSLIDRGLTLDSDHARS